jgi:hypothetical protein
MHLRHEVPVAIERGLNRGVAELSLDVLWMGPLRDEKTRVRVAQIVKPDALELRSAQHPGPLPAAEVVWIHDAARGRGEHHFALEATRQPGERCLQRGRQVYGAP